MTILSPIKCVHSFNQYSCFWILTNLSRMPVWITRWIKQPLTTHTCSDVGIFNVFSKNPHSFYDSQFKLEDATATPTASATPTVDTNTTSQRRINSKLRIFHIEWRLFDFTCDFFCFSDLTSTNSIARPVSAPIISNATTENASDRVKDAPVISTDVTISLKKNRSSEDKGKHRWELFPTFGLYCRMLHIAENEKDNDSRGGQATQALIQRRRRPKRRSTGVCNVSAEDGEADRQDSPVDGDEVNTLILIHFVLPKKIELEIEIRRAWCESPDG